MVIVTRINELCHQVLGPEKSRNITQIHEKIAALNAENQVHPIGGTKIKNELQSYDLLQNVKYNRLEELKRVLESVSN